MVQAYPELLHCTRPKAGPIAFPKLTHPSMSVDTLSLELVEKQVYWSFLGVCTMRGVREHFTGRLRAEMPLKRFRVSRPSWRV